jgi:hypothetical protein
MRINFFVAIFALVWAAASIPALASPVASATADSPTISLCGAVQPTKIGLRDKKCFVVIQNKTKTALNIWAEDCSWGWANISFEVKAGEKILSVNRDEVNWKRNFPMPLKLLPGDMSVREINLEDRTWSWNKVVDFCRENPRASISAKLEIKSDSSTKAEHVWTGAVRSKRSCDLY